MNNSLANLRTNSQSFSITLRWTMRDPSDKKIDWGKVVMIIAGFTALASLLLAAYLS
jgi:hypothetical protein